MICEIEAVLVGVVLVPTTSLPNGANRDCETVLGTFQTPRPYAVFAIRQAHDLWRAKPLH
ncbi:MAG: hypothetical protein ACSHYA_06365 [Opitutaceae bacterium]